MNIIQYLGDLMSCLLDIESFLNSILPEKMDKDDEMERQSLLLWCKTYQQAVALITQTLRSSDLKNPSLAEESVKMLLLIEDFIEDLNDDLPELKWHNSIENFLEELNRSE